MAGKTRARRAETSRLAQDAPRDVPILLDDRALSVPIYRTENAEPSPRPLSDDAPDAPDAPNAKTASRGERPRPRPQIPNSSDFPVPANRANVCPGADLATLGEAIVAGNGRIYQRGEIYFIAYSHAGQEFRESTRSRDIEDAKRLLASRVMAESPREVTPGLHCERIECTR